MDPIWAPIWATVLTPILAALAVAIKPGLEAIAAAERLLLAFAGLAFTARTLG